MRAHPVLRNHNSQGQNSGAISLRPGRDRVAKAGPSPPTQADSTPSPHLKAPCLPAAYEADGTGLQYTEAFWQSVSPLDVATALQEAAHQGASLQGNWQGEGAGSQHCLQRERAHISASSMTVPSSHTQHSWLGPGAEAFSRALCQNLDNLTCLLPEYIKIVGNGPSLPFSSVRQQCHGKGNTCGCTCPYLPSYA